MLDRCFDKKFWELNVQSVFDNMPRTSRNPVKDDDEVKEIGRNEEIKKVYSKSFVKST